MALDTILDALSARWTKSLLGITLSALGGVAVYGYTQVSAWVEGVKETASAHEARDREQDLKLERLTIIVEQTSKTVDKLAESLERQSDKRDERARRMDRLLDLLEKTSHTRPKESE